MKIVSLFLLLKYELLCGGSCPMVLNKSRAPSNHVLVLQRGTSRGQCWSSLVSLLMAAPAPLPRCKWATTRASGDALPLVDYWRLVSVQLWPPADDAFTLPGVLKMPKSLRLQTAASSFFVICVFHFMFLMFVLFQLLLPTDAISLQFLFWDDVSF